MTDIFGTMGLALIMAMIAGIVELAKTIQVDGVKWPMVLSAVLGLVFGLLYQLSQTIPNDFAGWLTVVIYSVCLGLAVSGFYDLARKAGVALTNRVKITSYEFDDEYDDDEDDEDVAVE